MHVSTSNNGRSRGIRESHAVGGDNRHVKRRRKIDQPLIVDVFIAQQMTLNFDVDIAAAEQANQRINHAADAVSLGCEQIAAGKRHEAVRLSFEVGKGERAFAFGRPHLHPRDQTTEIAVPLGGFDEDRHAEGRGMRAEGRGLRAEG